MIWVKNWAIDLFFCNGGLAVRQPHPSAGRLYADGT